MVIGLSASVQMAGALQPIRSTIVNLPTIMDRGSRQRFPHLPHVAAGVLGPAAHVAWANLVGPLGKSLVSCVSKA